jgi:MEMO1 family protein
MNIQIFSRPLKTERMQNDKTITLSGFYPQLRSGVEPFVAKDDQDHILIGLNDQFRLSQQEVYLPQDLFYLLQFFDGKHAAVELRVKYVQQFGSFLSVNRLIEFLEILNENYLLKNERFAGRMREVQEAYRQLPLRVPVCAGSSYPDDPDQLRKFLENLVTGVQNKKKVSGVYSAEKIRALIVPHIDIRLGGKVYAPAYRLLRDSQTADLYVILGIGHQGINNFFATTTQDFQTPLGLVSTDASLVRTVNEYCDFDFLQEEMIHQREHSIEFQTLFLQHFTRTPFKILPILCSFAPESYDLNRRLFDRFITGLQRALANYPGRVCFIASVDFAHVGPRYGDEEAPSPLFMTDVESNDREILNACMNWDADAFQSIIRSTNDRYRICGYAALTALFSLLPPVKGHQLAYGRAVMDEKHSTVTFASMVF